jgi:thiamine pyrophosphokinase
MRVILFANGRIDDYNAIRPFLRAYHFMICCDGGVRHAKALGLVPDVILGDLDSAPPDILMEWQAQNVPVVVYPTDKDFTDLELAIAYIREQMAGQDISLDIFGALGGRFDHSLMNCHILLQALQAGLHARLVDEYAIVTLIDESIRLMGKAGEIVSLIPLTTETEGVETEGLRYPLCDETLRVGYGRGVSNVMTGDAAAVRVKKGLLLVIQASCASMRFPA